MSFDDLLKDIQTDSNIIITNSDPLAGVCSEPTQMFYRINDTVFAEPLETMEFIKEETEPEAASEEETVDDDELTSIDKVIVRKRPGKRNRYFYDDQDPDNPVCPQDKCKKQFKSTTLLKNHIRRVHCADYSRFICESCGHGFPLKYLLKRHSAVHERRKVKCHVCGKMLSERSNVKAHIRSHKCNSVDHSAKESPYQRPAI